MVKDRGGARTPEQLSILSSSCVLAGSGGPGTSLRGGHVDHEAHHPVAVA